MGKRPLVFLGLLLSNLYLLVDNSLAQQPVRVLLTTPQGADAGTSTDPVTITCISGCGSPPATPDNSVFTGGTTSVSPFAALFDTTPPTITDGNYGIPRMDSSRYLFTVFPSAQHIICDSGCGASSFPDNSAFTFGTTSVTVGAGVLDDVSPNAATENSAAAFRISSNRMQLFQLADGDGNERRAFVNSDNQLEVRVGNVASDSVKIDVVRWGGATPSGAIAGPQTDAQPNTHALPPMAGFGFLFNGTSWDRWRSVVNGANSVGTGIAAAGLVGQFDDTTPTSITENQFGNLRISANRNLFGTIRDAAGNERGANVTAANALVVDGSATTQPVSGTVTANQGTPTNWAMNVAQWGASNVAAAAVPIDDMSNSFALPKVVAYNAVFDGSTWDRLLEAAHALNSTGTGIPTAQIVGQFDNVSPTTITEDQFGNLRMSANRNLFTTLRDAAGNERGVNVTAANALVTDGSAVTQPVSGTVTANQGTANATPWNMNLAQVAGTTTVTAAAGVQRVGIVGNANAAFDAANNAAAPANVLVPGVEVIAQGSQPTAASAGNVRRVLATTEGVQFVQEGSSNRFSCFVQAVTATTQCQAAPGAGLRAYVTSVMMSNQAATVQTLDIVFGTGTNCATGTTALTHKVQMGTNATTTSPFFVPMQFQTPLIPTAANAICVRPSAATAFGATITGFIAP